MHLYEENKTRTSCINGIRDILAKTLLICSLDVAMSRKIYTSTSNSRFVQNAPCVIRTRVIFARINGPILSTN